AKPPNREPIRRDKQVAELVRRHPRPGIVLLNGVVELEAPGAVSARAREGFGEIDHLANRALAAARVRERPRHPDMHQAVALDLARDDAVADAALVRARVRVRVLVADPLQVATRVVLRRKADSLEDLLVRDARAALDRLRRTADVAGVEPVEVREGVRVAREDVPDPPLPGEVRLDAGHLVVGLGSARIPRFSVVVVELLRLCK